MIDFFEEMKRFFFSFSYFDVQFITFNELLHSDVTMMDGMWSRGAISYMISFFTLGLMIYDLRWFLISSGRLYQKKCKNIELSNQEEAEAEFFFEDVKTGSEISFSAMNFTLFSMVRFSFYQLIIVSVQLSPNFQTGFLLTLQIIFFIFYFNKYTKEKFFESVFTFIIFLVFETCITVFLLLSFVFSFENVGLWFSSSVTGWLQIISAGMIVISVVVEFITLVFKIILNVIEQIKKMFSKSAAQKSKIAKITPEDNNKKEKGQNKKNNQRVAKMRNGFDTALPNKQKAPIESRLMMSSDHNPNNNSGQSAWLGLNKEGFLEANWIKSNPTTNSEKMKANSNEFLIKNQQRERSQTRGFLKSTKNKKSLKMIQKENDGELSRNQENDENNHEELQIHNKIDLFNQKTLKTDQQGPLRQEKNSEGRDKAIDSSERNSLVLNQNHPINGAFSSKDSEPKISPFTNKAKFSNQALRKRGKLISKNKLKSRMSLKSRQIERNRLSIKIGESGLQLEGKEPKDDKSLSKIQ